jgi:outer membrane protein assembly factor BamB
MHTVHMASEPEERTASALTSGSTMDGAATPEQPPVTPTPTSGPSATNVIRFSGSHVYALRPDGNRSWTARTDGTLVGPPVVRGTEVYVTTVKGTRYTLRASDGAISSRVPADAKRSKRKGDQGEKENASGD